MSAPVPGINNPDPTVANISLPPTAKKMGEFMVSTDGKTASKEIVVDGKNLIFTVNFPASVKTDHDRGLILKQFTETHIIDMGRYARLLGLGTKDTVTSVDFRSNKEGDLEATKNRKNPQDTKNYIVKRQIAHYEQKINTLKQDPAKKEQLQRSEAKYRALVTITPFWRDLKKPVEQKKIDDAEQAKVDQAKKAEGIKKPKGKKTKADTPAQQQPEAPATKLAKPTNGEKASDAAPKPQTPPSAAQQPNPS